MRCSEWVRWAVGVPALLGGLLILQGSAAAAGVSKADAGVDAGLRAIDQQAGAIAEALAHQSIPGWLDAAQGRAEALTEGVRALAEHAEAIINGAHGETTGAASEAAGRGAGPGGAATPTVTFTLFASRSLGDDQLRDLFTFAAGRTDTRIVFRGVGEDASLIDFVASLKPLLRDLDPPPTVLLDPMPFRAHGITAVPTLIAFGPDGDVLARVAGLATTGWLREALAAGQRGDLGTRGPVREIIEPDLLETIHRRLAHIDFSALGERAVERAFERLPFERLPVAGEDRERLIDPTLTAAADIRLPDGTVLVRAGESVNPLDRLPFTQRLVVFDAADSRQLAFARALASAPSRRPTTFLLSGLPRRDGWAALGRVMAALDRRVYLLTPALRQRFALERVPAVVEAVGRRFRVTEQGVVGPVAAEVGP